MVERCQEATEKFHYNFPKAHSLIVALIGNDLTLALQNAKIVADSGVDGVAIISSDPLFGLHVAGEIKQHYPTMQSIVDILAMDFTQIYNLLIRRRDKINGITIRDSDEFTYKQGKDSTNLEKLLALQNEWDGVFFGPLQGWAKNPGTHSLRDVIVTNGLNDGTLFPEELEVLQENNGAYPTVHANGITSENIHTHISDHDMSIVLSGLTISDTNFLLRAAKVNELAQVVKKYNDAKGKVRAR